MMESTYPLSGERTANVPPSFGRRGAGELLDQVFSLYRRGFLKFVAVTALMLVPMAIVSLLQRQFEANALGSLFTLVNGVLGVAYYALVPAAVCLVATALLRGQSLSLDAAYGQARGRFWALFRLAVLKYLVMMVYVLVAGIVFLVLTLASQFVGPWLFVPAVAGSLAVGVYLFIKWSLAEPALLFETDLKARQSFGRSAVLVAGSMRRLGLVLGAMWLISVGLSLVISITGLAVTGELRALLDAAGSGQLPTALTGLAKSQGLRVDVILSLFNTTGSVLLAPLTGIVQAVLYSTQRSDVEGADLLAQAETVSEAA
jgi:hypothetical protein